MNQPVQPHKLSRRTLLKRGIESLAGIAVVTLTGGPAHSADRKLQKTAVHYQDASKLKDQDCDDCIQFIPGASEKARGTCKIVDGSIDPHGHCDAFAAKPKS